MTGPLTDPEPGTEANNEAQTFGGSPRPRHRPWHAVTELDHFVIVTYRVDTDALAAAIPAAFVPEVFTFDDGTSGSLVSAVPFVDRDFRFRGIPFIKMACGQVNYRAYVTWRGERGVYFFGTSLDHALVAIPRGLWRMPWHRDRVTLGHTTEGDIFEAGSMLHFIGGGDWGRGSLVAKTTDVPFGRLDGFRTANETAEILTHPVVGWYQRMPNRRRPHKPQVLGRYEIWHPPVEAVLCEPLDARFAVFERHGLTTPRSVPHSVLYQPSIHFDILTPPRRLPS